MPVCRPTPVAWAANLLLRSQPRREPAVSGAATLNVPTLTDLGYENAGDGFRHPVLRLQERPASCALDHRVANGSCGRCHP